MSYRSEAPPIALESEDDKYLDGFVEAYKDVLKEELPLPPEDDLRYKVVKMIKEAARQ